MTNTTLEKMCSGVISEWEKTIPLLRYVLEDGEQYKSLETWSGILDFLLESHLDRDTVIIAFGGGVVGDIAGFAASSFMRGVNYVQVPTTLLAMVDSSVGGKTGVNHAMGKNLIGSFYQPRLVWITTGILGSLPPRHYFAGYAEVFKYAFIGGREMFDFITEHHDKIVSLDTEKL
ncbi:MAG: 3-dehydroquinate synthase, partial [Planctomycetes bacterium]|nr:3-dehydroquinate synthase [Planctomycetota bacterium]